MGRLFFLPQHLFPQLLPLLQLLCLHHLSKTLLKKSFSFLHFPVHSALDSSFISLSSPPSYSDSLSSLANHTSMDRPASSSSCTLTSPLPSSLPPPYSIYRPLPIYASSRPFSFSVGPIPHLYASVLSTNTLSLSHHGSSSTRVSSASSRSWTMDWLRSWPRDNTYYTTRRQCPRPAIPGSSLSSNTVLFPLLSSWANPSSYQDNPMNLTCSPRTNLQALGGSPSNPLFKSDSSYPHIYSPMVTFNEPSENVRGCSPLYTLLSFLLVLKTSFFSH